MPIVTSIAGQILDDVYVIETTSPPSIQGVQVGVVGMVGTFNQGIAGGMYSVSDYRTAVRLLGNSSSDVGGPVALQNMMRQGAGNIQVVPVFGAGAASAAKTLYDAAGTPVALGTLTAAQPHPQTGVMTAMYGAGPNAWTVTVSLPLTPDGTFNLTIRGSVTEQYYRLLPSTWAAVVNAVSQIVIVSQPATPSSLVPAAGSFSFSGGANGTLTVGSALDNAIVGSVGGGGATTGLAVFTALAPNVINLVFAAEVSSATINAALASYANTNNAIALLCAPSGQTVSQTQALAIYSQDNVAYIDGWTNCFDADTGAIRLCAPTALVAGVISLLGPQFSWGNKSISGTLGLAVSRSNTDMATLQQNGVLCLANTIPKGGFGTRSGVAGNRSQLYVRRMQYFLEFSIMGAMGWAVDALQSTQANDPLRNSVKQSIGAFLNGLAHPLVSQTKVIDSSLVVCDKTNNPDAQVAAGQLNVSVTVKLLAAANQILIACNISTSAITTPLTVTSSII